MSDRSGEADARSAPAGGPDPLAMPALAPGRSWDAMRRDFRWPNPPRLNIAEAICDRWARAEPERLALRHLGPRGAEEWSYGRLAAASRRLANVLSAAGVARGDRVAVLLPQSPAALLAHLAAYRLGAVAVPLFTLFGAEALAFRLADSGAKALVTDAANRPKLDGLDLPGLTRVLTVGGAGAEDFEPALARASDLHEMVATGPEDPAFISYTSGTTGPPKGALHAHRVLIGHLPGVRLAHEFLPQPSDVMWTPADWAWMGGLCNVMMPALCLGVPLVSHRFEKFDPEAAFALMAREGASCVFAPPTALRLMRQVERPLRFWEGAPRRLRTLACGGEALGAELLDWGREELGLTINEFYGQTECNKMIANAACAMAVKPGAMGRAAPGFEVGVIDGEGRALPPGESGEIAVKRGAAPMFLGYWNRPDKTAEKFAGDWMRTGDEGRMDAEGYFFFAARSDDVITSSGYRIGPSEIEDCLCRHPAVAMAAVVGEPDPVRTEAVVAHVVARPGFARDDALAAALTDHVRTRISAHVAPRRVVFVETLPMTATGKIMRRELRGTG
ncbi:acetyl-CoA synthetase [Rubrimonas cliftonensis]|uniref:Acetyl-CoA synthetase n=2 Tax=Rubrimonas cliftonensis TaxID=89524 RepID=A0A1H4C2E4_9RHOB|nr:AMP-binding protein [Rubrimonas cliftonensis]SEA54514.1 acetyl-CoA synthetase [Rubrimonas cliftonensis]